jgi:hypothetical protein
MPKLKLLLKSFECPICLANVQDLESHYKLEKERIDRLPLNSEKRSKRQPQKGTEQKAPLEESLFIKTQKKYFNRKNTTKVVSSSLCPICGISLPSDPDFVNAHVDSCLSKQEETLESWDEYEWAGSKRVRATSMMEGGLGSSFYVNKRKNDDIDEDVNIDLDEEYGESQYREADIRKYSFENEKPEILPDNNGDGNPDTLIIESLKSKIRDLVFSS